MQETVLITGAASGIGRACVDRFARAGWRVGALDIVDATGLRPAPDDGVVPLQADVTDATQLADAVRYLCDEPGTLRASVNAAGIYPMSSLESADVALYRRIFDINVLGTVLATQAAMAAMRDGGAVINFASVNAFMPMPDQLLYSAAKAAVVHLTRSMAIALAPRRIRVNAVAPGPVATDGMRQNPGRLQRVAAGVPLGRAAEPVEIADLVFWMITGEGSDYITGETIVAGGGLITR